MKENSRKNGRTYEGKKYAEMASWWVNGRNPWWKIFDKQESWYKFF